MVAISAIVVLPVDELLKKEFPPNDSILGAELLDRAGTMLISGPQKIGKSLLACQLALCLADGSSFLGFQTGTQRYRSLILQAEVSEKRMKERFAKQVTLFSDNSHPNVLNACVFSQIKLDSPDGQLILNGLLKQHSPDVVIIDPLTNFHTGNEQEVHGISRITSFLDGLRMKFKVAVVLIHHHGKSSRDRTNVGHKARGSSALAGWYDTHLSMEWNGAPADGLVRLQFELRNGETPKDKLLRLDSEILLFEVQGEEEEEPSPIDEVVKAVKLLGGQSITVQAVADFCSKSRAWASKYLNQAVDAGRLIATDTNPKKYCLAPLKA
jgi:hypothetical protein